MRTYSNGLTGLGYVMSYYEFALPSWERMTDAQWQTQVMTGTPPARPWWVEDLLASPDVH